MGFCNEALTAIGILTLCLCVIVLAAATLDKAGAFLNHRKMRLEHEIRLLEQELARKTEEVKHDENL